MKTTKEKALQFLTALLDVYRDEDNRELESFSKLELSGDVTDDFTAILLAVEVLFKRVTEYDGDIIDFTHILNKLAVQYVMESKED